MACTPQWTSIKGIDDGLDWMIVGVSECVVSAWLVGVDFGTCRVPNLILHGLASDGMKRARRLALAELSQGLHIYKVLAFKPCSATGS